MTIQFTLILGIILLISVLGLLIWLILALNKKMLLVPPKAETTIAHQQPFIDKSTATPKYAQSRLAAAKKKQLLNKVIIAMEIDKSYRQPDLTLQRLAAVIGVPKHQLSQVINEKLDRGFLDFVNRYRVEEAKEKLRDPVFQKVSILAIGQEVGFKAKSTFYAVFKKYTNRSPGDYRKIHSLKANKLIE